MSRFKNPATGVIVSVADEKDHRFESGWESADAPAKPKPKSKPKATEPVPEPEATEPTGEQAPQGNPEATEPPRSGPGSGRDAWATYAAARGIEVADSLTRDDLIAAVDALS